MEANMHEQKFFYIICYFQEEIAFTNHLLHARCGAKPTDTGVHFELTF